MLWKDKYALGVKLIDEQHKELFDRVDAFMKMLRSKKAWDDKVLSVNKTLEFMNGYVIEHFRDEEDYQLRIGYPGYEAHRRVHREMLDFVRETTKKYSESDYDEQLMQQLGGKLLSWLINHVGGEDQRIARYAIEKGVENA